MPVFRYYVDKEIVDGVGGDLSRTFDIEADDREQADELLAASDHPLADDEVLGQVTEVHMVPPIPDPEPMTVEPIPPPAGVILPPGVGM
jgi:hypothetical protein